MVVLQAVAEIASTVGIKTVFHFKWKSILRHAKSSKLVLWINPPPATSNNERSMIGCRILLPQAISVRGEAKSWKRIYGEGLAVLPDSHGIPSFKSDH